MTIRFNIRHAADYGEEVMLHVVVDDNGERRTAAVCMATSDGLSWTYCFDNVDSNANPHIDYFFTVDCAGRERKREWTATTHRLDLTTTRCGRVCVDNIWHDTPTDARLYTSAYTECLAPRRRAQSGGAPLKSGVRLVVRAPQLLPGERLAVVLGGSGDTARTVGMVEHNTCEWQADIDARLLAQDTTFRFAAVGEDGTEERESGDERTIAASEIQPDCIIVRELGEARFDRDTIRPHHINTSVARLRTEGSFGIGDFGDLATFLRHTAQTSQTRIVCVPPANDTISTNTSADANPYSTISVFALHPLLCDLRQLPAIVDPSERVRMEELRSALNATADYDYTATLSAKLNYLRCVFRQEGDRTMHTAAFRHFFTDNEHWLVPYAQYSYLRDAYAIANFRQWPNHTEWTEAERGPLQNTRTKAYKKLAFFYYVQFVLHQQLAAVHTLARQLGIVLAGDMTANINPNGCDTWQHAELVGTDEWWTRRLGAMADYYDACRVAESLLERRRVTGATRLWLDKFA